MVDLWEAFACLALPARELEAWPKISTHFPGTLHFGHFITPLVTGQGGYGATGSTPQQLGSLGSFSNSWSCPGANASTIEMRLKCFAIYFFFLSLAFYKAMCVQNM